MQSCHDTTVALNQQFGEPHQLALQQFTELMDGPNIVTGYVKLFQTFALKAHSLGSILEGVVELECESQVSQLIRKLPHDLRSSFHRFIHPQRVPIFTFMTCPTSWSYRSMMQVDTSIFGSRKEARIKREPCRPAKPSGNSAIILMGTGQPLSEVKPKDSASQKKGKK
ncbi:hypothetical protein VZT92_020756 [Zoarces viviparus]|uniref:Retrotransposon gag domain-containing protein n=1 Tax=Zoarces viviparus TaxID=48416 RepID=A0AAW1EF88_ZOAVI